MAASADAAEAERAIGAATAAFGEWRDVRPEARAEYLFKAAEAARKQRYELAALEVLEAGKTWSEADADVCEAIDFLEYYGREMIRLGTPRRMGRAPGRRVISFMNRMASLPSSRRGTSLSPFRWAWFPPPL